MPAKKPETQYTFTVSRGCNDSDKGEVTLHTEGDDKSQDKSYTCTCDVD